MDLGCSSVFIVNILHTLKLIIIVMIFVLRGPKCYFRPGPPKSQDRPWASGGSHDGRVGEGKRSWAVRTWQESGVVYV